jgi:hypothetical protein
MIEFATDQSKMDDEFIYGLSVTTPDGKQIDPSTIIHKKDGTIEVIKKPTKNMSEIFRSALNKTTQGIK